MYKLMHLIVEPNRDMLTKILKKLLCKRKYAIACIGSELRGDDRIGLIIGRELSKRNVQSVLICEYGLENCINEIKDMNIDTLLIIDAVLVNSVEPGKIVFVDEAHLVENYMITTHNIPISLTLKLLKLYNKNLENIIIIGIRVKNLEIGFDVTDEVLCAAKALVDALIKAVRGCYTN